MILHADTDEAILATYPAVRQLRPHLPEHEYLGTIRRMMEHERYRLVAAIEEGAVRAVAGYRLMEMLYCGRILSIDDLVTDDRHRSAGFGKALLDWLTRQALAMGCREIHLDSRVQRQQAHRFYFREGFAISCFHFAKELTAS